MRETFAVIIFSLLKVPGLSETAVLAAYLTNPLIVLVIPGAVGVVAAWIAGVTRQLRAEAQD